MQQFGLSAKELSKPILASLQTSIEEFVNAEKTGEYSGNESVARLLGRMSAQLALSVGDAIEANNQKILEQIRSGEIEI